MAKPNYNQAKRQKELARKARQAQKLQRKIRPASDAGTDEGAPEPTSGAVAGPAPDGQA